MTLVEFSPFFKKALAVIVLKKRTSISQKTERWMDYLDKRSGIWDVLNPSVLEK